MAPARTGTEVTAPAPEVLFILPGAANAATLSPQVTVGAMRSQLTTGFLGRNPNPTAASRKPGDILGSDASVAREGFGGGFGSVTARVSPGAQPAVPAPAPLSLLRDEPQLWLPLQLPRDRSFPRSPKINPWGIPSTGKWKCSSNRALLVPRELSSSSWPPPQQMEEIRALSAKRSNQAAVGKGDAGTWTRALCSQPFHPILLFPIQMKYCFPACGPQCKAFRLSHLAVYKIPVLKNNCPMLFCNGTLVIRALMNDLYEHGRALPSTDQENPL